MERNHCEASESLAFLENGLRFRHGKEYHTGVSFECSNPLRSPLHSGH
jgi:hypothetical protein